ncbi:hypothetical protein Tco_0022633, partial [Tanacetum coccineum]
NLLRGGNSASGIFSLQSTGGINNKFGSCGSCGSGDVGTGGGKCSDDGGAGNGSDGRSG